MRVFFPASVLVAFCAVSWLTVVQGQEVVIEPVVQQDVDVIDNIAEESTNSEVVVAEDQVAQDLEKLGIEDLIIEAESDLGKQNPDDPCRKIRDLTTKLRESATLIASKTTELIRVRGEERQAVRDEIRRLREDVSKTNTLIRENTRDCARSRRPTLRPQPTSV